MILFEKLKNEDERIRNYFYLKRLILKILKNNISNKMHFKFVLILV